ncbi:hypothetical protein BFU36_11720 [Sulfolobus sp. A20]|uniref:hypothetical protein n=1 Tax=Saccharolobus sp. A20 TaxID=1891280 RepID=UPI000845E039|nr:hypothetical protein [Sulfolobus sp. A20]AOL17263.1 hypothetical protein BFU36_11720 [Sulfolobus sp. A20]
MYTKTVALLLTLLLLCLSSISIHSTQEIIYGPTNYGYEFGYVRMNGIQSIIKMYNLSVTSGSPSISIQQNINLNINGEDTFVQNVVQPLTINKSMWTTSIYYNGHFTVSFFSYLIGSEINLTTIWAPKGNITTITFYASNGTSTFNKSYVLEGKFMDIIYDGYTIGTVVGGYGNGETAYLAKGFNISIATFYEYNGSWYVPPVVYSGFPNTGEQAFNGKAYFYDGKVWVVYGNVSGPQLLYNFSVVIVNNTVYTFPPNSLWVLNNQRFFENQTSFEIGDKLSPFMTINYTFILEKKIELTFPQPVEIDGVKSKVFYLPCPETVYIDEGGKLIAEYVNSSINFSSLSYTTSSLPSEGLVLYVVIITLAVVLLLLLPTKYVRRKGG